MNLDVLLQRQGFGTRRGCRVLVHQGRVAVRGEVIDDPDTQVEEEGTEFSVDGEAWIARGRVVLMMHKPVDYEVSRKPQHHPSVHSLLPEPLNARGVQAAGRLDTDTTGLLLFSDDGTLIHALTSPKHEVHKTYDVTLVHPCTPELIHALKSGVQLHDEPGPLSAVSAAATGPDTLHIVLREGKYHQVKRMIGAAGNRVLALHRPAVGSLSLPADLMPGEWRYLTNEELNRVWGAAPRARA
ncbi:pseudouridine synthase [Deltaproteobacteria bacterium]|nr:pseudouridine synthase [Deltaproteobacteria bacterium]